jgi:hypothetical protein
VSGRRNKNAPPAEAARRTEACRSRGNSDAPSLRQDDQQRAEAVLHRPDFTVSEDLRGEFLAHCQLPLAATMNSLYSCKGSAIVVEHDREMDQAVSALAAEILKLSPLEGEARDLLSITIENAFSQLAQAILAHANQTQEKCLEEATPEVASA